MQDYSANPREMFESYWRNRELVKSLIRREVIGRYKGSIIGVLWSLLNPIFMLLIYTFVFSVIFKARWNGAVGGSTTEFALVLFAGLLVFNLFAECVNRSPGLIVLNANYVKKVIFPIEILPMVTMGSALFHFVVGFAIWVTAYIVLQGIPHWTILISPIAIAPLVIFVMGLCWILAALGAYVRDISQMIGVATQVLMFLSPIFYPASALPESYRHWIYLNPMTPPVEIFRDLVYWGQIPDLDMLILNLISSMVVGLLGFAFFQKTRKGFADVV